MTKRSVTHGSFTIDRTYDATPARVFKAFSDASAKAAWFAGPDDWARDQHQLDFRVGGREHSAGGAKGGPIYSYDATFQDIVPNERIVYTYDMHMDDKRISVSLATIELSPVPRGTRLVLTEHGAFLDGYDDPAAREHGTKELLGSLDQALRTGKIT